LRPQRSRRQRRLRAFRDGRARRKRQTAAPSPQGRAKCSIVSWSEPNASGEPCNTNGCQSIAGRQARNGIETKATRRQYDRSRPWRQCNRPTFRSNRVGRHDGLRRRLRGGELPRANKLTVHILAAVAKHEQGVSERTKAALAAAKVPGEAAGHAGPRRCRRPNAAGVVEPPHRHNKHFLGTHSNLATLGHFLLVARPRVFDCL
jgi:hypothetical protein